MTSTSTGTKAWLSGDLLSKRIKQAKLGGGGRRKKVMKMDVSIRVWWDRGSRELINRVVCD